MTDQLSRLIADYRAGRVSTAELSRLLSRLRDGDRTCALSQAQHGLWLLQQAYPDCAAYNVPLCFRVDALDVVLFERACRLVQAGQPVLSTVIRRVGGAPRQSVDPDRELDFAAVELPAGLSEDAALAVVRAESKRPFRLDGDALVRIRVYLRPSGAALVLVCVHHVIFDGSSARLFTEALFAGYEALCTDVTPAPAEPPAASMPEFVAAEQRRLAERRDDLLGYWRDRLRGPLPLLSLPTERPPAAVMDRFAGATYVRALPAGLAEGASGAAGRDRGYLSTTLLAAYTLTLASYSDTAELVVGMPVNERTPELAGAIGLMINMMPVRVTLAGDETFGELVGRVQAGVLDGMLHSFPFPVLARELAAPAEPVRPPVFQTAFVYQDVLDGMVTGAGRHRWVAEVHQEGEYELTVEVWRADDGFVLYWMYHPELFSRAFVEELAERYQRLLDLVSADPVVPVAELRRQLAQPAGGKVQDGVHDLVATVVERRPDAVAVADRNRRLTYRELRERSGALAARLRTQGAGGGTLVTVLLDRSADLVVALLAVLEAGAAYVPLDPEFPTIRLVDIVTDSRPAVMLTESRLAGRAAELAAHHPDATLVVLDEPAPDRPAAVAPARVVGADLAYVVYTSGSTGKPKGVMIPHCGFVNLLRSMAVEPGMTEADVLFAVTTISFDMAQLEVFLPLATGAQVYVCDQPTLKDVGALTARLTEVRPTVMQATPAMWSMLFRTGWTNPERLRIFTGGEPLPRTLKEHFLATGSQAWNLYGPTEATVYSTGTRVRAGAPITIGRPIANTQIHIVDERLRPVPDGETGELCIAGVGLAAGYLNRPELTAEKFVVNPFGPGRLYRTGDLARRTPDGEIDYLGRVDFQVKIRGYRVELGDVEYHLGRHPDVAECVVVARGADAARQLVAYCRPRRPEAGLAQPEEFRRFLREQMPAYMVPDFFVATDDFPLTGSGKIDRAALSRREITFAAAAAETPVPKVLTAAQVEARVLACWQDVLQVRDLAPDHSFLQVGGNSLAAVTVAERLRAEFDIPFAGADLFRYVTPRAIAEYVRSVGEKAEPAVPDGAVAVIGISCHLPGARDHREFWANLCAGREAARFLAGDELHGVPGQVRTMRDYVPVRYGIDGKDRFDGEFFRFSPGHVALMDPQFRQLLLHAWRVVEDAGYDHRDMPNTGVYVSTANHFYGAHSGAPVPADVVADPAQYLSWVMCQNGTVPAMISYQLGFGGPSLSVHSNCSSSLSALAVAVRAVQAGEVDFALVAAASAAHVDSRGYVHQPGLNLSGDGHVKAFDAQADGMVGGEGVAAILIRQATAAVAAGDHIYALVRGVATNSDGGGSGSFYSPSVTGQARVIRQALRQAGVDPRTIGYVEAHGTGTRLGDPIEVGALTEAYRAATGNGALDAGSCGIGSVKSNIGHLDTAAGLAGAIKVLLALHHRQIPPTVNYHTPNPELRLADSPFFVVDRLRDWPAGPTPRRAAQSSFGLGGANTHAVFEEYRPAPVGTDDGQPQLVVLSARTRENLLDYVAELRRFLAGGPCPRLADLAYTLQVGRVPMVCRVAFVVRDLDQLDRELAGYAADAPSTRRFTGEVPRNGADDPVRDAKTAQLAAAGKLKKLARAWVAGTAVDWRRLPRSGEVRRVSLPVYRFSPVRHPWPARTPTRGELHPLIHENVSRLGRHGYRSRFTGTEPLLRDHLVDGRPLLPAVAGLEIAHAAARLAVPDAPRISLRTVSWARPVVVDADGAELDLTLSADRPDRPTVLRFELTGRGRPYVQGRAVVERTEPAPPPPIELDRLRAVLALRPLSGDECYPWIAAAGVAYGPTFRLVDTVWRGERDGRREALALLRLPEPVDAGGYLVHPGLLDAAIHASLGLDPRLDEATGAAAPVGATAVPFGLDRLDVYGPPDQIMYAWVRPAPGQRTDPAGGRPALDIDLITEQGQVSVSLRGLSFRSLATRSGAEPGAGGSRLRTLLPVWEPVYPESGPATAPAAGAVLVFDGADRLTPGFAGHRIRPAGSVEEIAEQIRRAGPRIARVVWVAPPEPPDGLAGMVEAQEHGVVEVYRIAKALLALGYGTRPLAFTALTFGTQQVRADDPVAPTHAGVHGLLGSLAREHTRWDVRLADLPAEPAGDEPRVLADEPHPAGVDSGATVALRGGRWFTLRVVPAPPLPAAASPAYRRRGVYVVVGGAGGVGELWSRHLVRDYQATIFWIGRQEPTAEIDGKLAGLAELARDRGAEPPRYLTADARDPAALAAAYRRITERHTHVDGVVHSAIVLADRTLANMTEDGLRAALSAKVDVAVNIARVFAGTGLLLFFSSVESFQRAAGQANYAAGCTFKDAFAQALPHLVTDPGPVVKTVNWGYWGVAGVVSDDFYRDRMRAAGIDSLHPEQALPALADLVAGGHRQVALMQTFDDRPLHDLAGGERIERAPARLCPVVDVVEAGYRPPTGERARLRTQLPSGRTLRLATELLAATLSELDRDRVPAKYDRWLAESDRLIAGLGGPVAAAAELWRRWHDERPGWLAGANLSAQLGLVETCLRALPDVLTGAQPATEVLFPGASHGAAEAIYRGDPVAEYFNRQLSALVVVAVREWGRTNPGAQIRILEVGAGTGATSAALLAALEPLGDRVEEYRYTDLSKAFLFRAEERLAPAYPCLRTQLFDVQRPPAEQGVALGRYDVVVATNVLHATADIGRSLRHVKATMPAGGLLVLNEMSRNTVLAHLTFGLLDGWWLHRDGALRVPGSPVLDAEHWCEVLTDEGFDPVHLPDRDAHELGQQLLVAASDGVIRTREAHPAATAAQVTVPVHAPAAPDDRLVDQLTARVAATLKVPAAELDPDRDLFDYGLDSLLIGQLNSELGRDFDELPSTLFFDHPTIHAAAAALRALVPAQAPAVDPPVAPAAGPAAAAVPESPAAAGTDIAIVGLAGRYPGAETVDELWTLLRDGIAAISAYPADRWWCRWDEPDRPLGGYLTNVAGFDAEFFGIDAADAAEMHPHERLFVQTVHHAVADAGHTPRDLAERGRVGVFVGAMNSAYNGRTTHSSIANRTSYLFDFQGPSIAVDTACSSSLTAIHLAVQSLRTAESDTAVAGGVNLLLDREHFDLLADHQLLSAGERCRPFSAHADGFLPAEGVGAVVLRPLAAALADGDHVYAVIKGSAVNAGGRTRRYTVPNPHAQRTVITRALAGSGVDPSTISYVEAHGTATALGDSIEVSALSRAYGGDTQYCAIGSIKSNFGHAESASGIAGLTKVLLQLRHGQLAPSINAEELNTGIGFARSPFFVQRELAPWSAVDAAGQPVPRRAGISCFGAGGANAHLIVEEYRQPAPPPAPGTRSVVVPLSARTPEQLREVVARLIAALTADPPPLLALAYTLQVGREPLPVRWVGVVGSVGELLGELRAYLHAGEVSPAARQHQLAGRWLSGADVACAELWPAGSPGRISLPGYPFATVAHWYRAAPAPAPAYPPAPVPAPTPVPAGAGDRRDDLRRWLTEAVAELLGTGPDQVRTDLGYLALGVSSAGLVRLAGRITDELDPTFEPALLFEHDTVDRLAEHLAAIAGSSEDPAEPYPLSYGQQGLWALHRADPGSTAYHVPLCFQVDRLDVAALRTAFDRLLGRHELLTRAVRVEGGRLLVVPAPAGTAAAFTELRLATAAPDEVTALLRARAREPFDLARGPLCRLTVFELADGAARVLLNAHHLVLDGASAVILVQDLLAGYRALTASGPVPPAPEAGYDEFVAAEATACGGEQAAARLAYWRDRLAAPLPASAPPADRLEPRPGGAEYGATLATRLPADLSTRIVEYARATGVYPSAVLLAAYTALLQHHTQLPDVVVGVPVSTRPAARFDRTIGNFVTMLPLRARLDGAVPFSRLCRQVQVDLVTGIAHTYPLPALVRELGLAGVDEAAPVFGTAFMYQDWYADPTAGFDGFTHLPDLRQEGEYPLVCEVVPVDRAGTGFAVNWKYQPWRYDWATVDSLAGQYRHLLDGVLSDPDRPVADQPLASPAEIHTVTVAWNRTAVAYPELATHELFARQVAGTPDAVALVSGQETLTYRELDQRSTRLAAHLRGLGARPGRLVAVCLRRSPELVVALLGVMRSGAAYVPLDPGYPRDRLRHIIADAQPHVIVGQSALRDQAHDLAGAAIAAGGRPAVLLVDDLPATPAGTPNSPAEPRDPTALAYVIYTSGSTGTPKGVMIGHRALANFLCSMADRPGLGSGDRILAVTTHSFDIAALELFLPLVTGAQCHLSDPETATDAARLAALIGRSRPTVMQATPSTWTMLLHAGWRNPEGVRILCGGEALPQALKERLVALGEVWNLYGPTETTIWSTAERMTAGRRVTIGRPIGNTQVYLLDTAGRATAIGVPGELCIAGAGLADGYLGKPELTAQRFVDNPFTPGTRLYRTGDLARWRADGTVEWLERIDTQVKIRGFRIELGEIEHVLDDHPAVRESAVVARAQGETKQLVAYYTPAGASAGADELTAALRSQLPGHLVPAFVVPVDRLPRTPNGKIDRRALAARPAAPARAPAAVPAEGPDDAVLALWREVLGVDDLSPSDGFLDAGGNSVLAAVLADRVSTRYGVPFAPAEVFASATAAGMAGRLRTATTGQARAGDPPEPDGQPGYPAGSVAIIGISCRLPGADDTTQFWRNLLDGVESVEFCDRDELLRSGVTPALADDPRYVPVRASMTGKGGFDAEFFHLSARDAELMDPQLRLLLQHSWKAVEDAGYRPTDLADAGVYMSACNGLYQAPLAGRAARRDSEALVGFLLAQPGTIPTVISHHLGLRGPSLFVHSNCSSSLAGLALAVAAIRSGQTSCALVGGASVYGRATLGYLHEDGMTLSADGHTRPFSADATGMVGAEGVAVVLVKDAAAAVRDGDHVYALVRGIGMNNDGGRKAGYYAPSVPGQTEVVSAVLDQTGVAAESIRYLEAHGTGTAIGDPIEVLALAEAYRRHTDRTGFCGLGSVKSNVGHLDAAAGLAGLVKVALALEHGVVPPTVNYTAPNPQIDFAGTPFTVVDRATELPPDDTPWRAAVSSFGIGGTNVHAILEQPPAVRRDAAPDGPRLVPLSARGPANLRRYAAALAGYLAERPDVRLADVADTLQAGRTELPVRAAFGVETVAELVAALRGYAERGEPGHVRAGPGAGALAEAAARWVAGGDVDWAALRPAGSGPVRRISLPTYPFTEDEYWLAAPAATAEPVLYEERWVPAAGEPGAAAPVPHTVACFLSGDARQDAYQRTLGAHDPHARLVFVDRSQLDRDDEASWRRALEAAAGGGRLDAVHYLWPTEHPDSDACLRELADVARLLRALAATGQDAVDVLVGGNVRTPVEQATLDALVGYERSLAGALPQTTLRVVLHEGTATPERWAELCTAEQRQRHRVSTLYRAGRRHVCQVLPIDPPPAGALLRQPGTYLVTGAFGGLGRRVAEHLAAQYRANLVLVGRSPLRPDDETWVGSLRAHGGQVVCWQLDVTDETALAARLAALAPELRPLTGVVHAAGVAEPVALRDKAAGSVAAVLAAKVHGTLAVHRALGTDRPVLCLFSSVAATLGDFGSCDYAVANRFQAGYARAAGDNVVAIEWPLWADGGMGAAAQRGTDPEFVASYLVTTGQWPLPTDAGLRLTERLLTAGYRCPLVVPAAPADARALVERAVPPVPEPSPVPAGTAREDEAGLRRVVRDVVAHVLNQPADRLDDTANFADLGLDSIRLTQLAHRLSQRLAVTLSPTVLYDVPTIRELVDHLSGRAPVAGEESAAAMDEPIAIVGMSGIFPGCRSVAEFWDALAAGRDLVRPARETRLGSRLPAELTSLGFGGIDWAGEFDAAFFEMTPKEARITDPRQRHLLQECWKALEDAALGPDLLAGRRVGVFVGVEQGDYRLLVGDGGNLTANHDGVLAARLSYFLDLSGPALAVNTSCSSGLVALHQAAAALRQGDCELAVVAAANVVFTAESLAAMSQAGMLSERGRCATFDQHADGMVPGDAVVAVVLRPLAAAQAAGDPVYGVVAASGLNYDGRTNGITAPGGAAQRALLESVYRRGGIDPARVGYLVTHGTGTRLGDPVEVNALRQFFPPRPDGTAYCALTSTKTNVGHTFAASGLVSLVCLTEAVRRGVIPASLHCEQPNEYLDLAGGPLYVNTATRPWRVAGGGPRLGGVSAFGMSGTNAHVVVREYRPPVLAPVRTQPYHLLPLSAKTGTALTRLVEAMLDELRRGGLTDADLPRLAETLQRGRHHFRYRAAIVVASLDEAVAGWTQLLDQPGTTPVTREFTPDPTTGDRVEALLGQAYDTRLDAAARGDALRAIVRRYVEGYHIPWRPLPAEGPRPARLRLPTYPFASTRYLLNSGSAGTGSPDGAPGGPRPGAKPTGIVLADPADRDPVPHGAPLAKPTAVALPPLPGGRPPAGTGRATREHDVLEDLKSAADIGFGGMVATLNRTGVMVEHLIPYSAEFAEYAGRCGGEVLDLGCAYGVASVAALERGAQVVALDMERRHLEILAERLTDEARQRLTVVRGVLPDVDFEPGRFTAVHAGRVLHFLRPDEVRLVLRRMFDWLVPGGKVFLSTDSPYFGYWAPAAPEYEARKRAGDPWPGFIDNVADRFDRAGVAGGPSVINALDPDVFRRECTAAGFVVERTGYFGAVGVDRPAQGAPGPDMEHAGVIATKPAPPAGGQVARSADGTAIHYRRTGRGDTALVLIHGLGCDASFWRHQVAHFADRYTVIALDLAGHGRSGTRRERFTVEAFAADVAAVVADAGVPEVVLVGHSLGGPVMLAAAPLLPARVRGMVGVDTLHNLDARLLRDDQIDRFVQSFADEPVRAQEMFLDPRPDLVELAEQSRERTGAAAITSAFRELLGYLRKLPARMPAPVALVNSATWAPTNLDAARRRGVDVQLLEGVGHFPMVEAPEAFNTALAGAIAGVVAG